MYNVSLVEMVEALDQAANYKFCNNAWSTYLFLAKGVFVVDIITEVAAVEIVHQKV